MDSQKNEIQIQSPISVREESLKLNLWKLFYRKTTKLSLTYKTPSVPCRVRLNYGTENNSDPCRRYSCKPRAPGGDRHVV